MCKETLVPTIPWGGTRTADVQGNAEAESLSITWRQHRGSGKWIKQKQCEIQRNFGRALGMAVTAVLHIAKCLQPDDKKQKAVQGDFSGYCG